MLSHMGERKNAGQGRGRGSATSESKRSESAARHWSEPRQHLTQRQSDARGGRSARLRKECDLRSRQKQLASRKDNSEPSRSSALRKNERSALIDFIRKRS